MGQAAVTGPTEARVSVGIPAFNRPEGLAAALDSAVGQTHRNLEICVSDNASPDPRVREVALEFAARDARVRLATQATNLGPARNFRFLAEQVSSPYFILLADDDVWPAHHVERLLARMDPSVLLVFPDLTAVDHEGRRAPQVLSRAYAGCETDADYLEAWVGSLLGYPFYGLYHLDRLREAGITFDLLDADLDYNNEGVFLHTMMLHGGVRFCSETSLVYNTAASRPRPARSLQVFTEYTARMTSVYLESARLDDPERWRLLSVLMDRHCEQIRTLCRRGLIEATE